MVIGKAVLCRNPHYVFAQRLRSPWRAPEVCRAAAKLFYAAIPITSLLSVGEVPGARRKSAQAGRYLQGVADRARGGARPLQVEAEDAGRDGCQTPHGKVGSAPADVACGMQRRVAQLPVRLEKLAVRLSKSRKGDESVRLVPPGNCGTMVVLLIRE